MDRVDRYVFDRRRLVLVGNQPASNFLVRTMLEVVGRAQVVYSHPVSWFAVDLVLGASLAVTFRWPASTCRAAHDDERHSTSKASEGIVTRWELTAYLTTRMELVGGNEEGGVRDPISCDESAKQKAKAYRRRRPTAFSVKSGRLGLMKDHRRSPFGSRSSEGR